METCHSSLNTIFPRTSGLQSNMTHLLIIKGLLDTQVFVKSIQTQTSSYYQVALSKTVAFQWVTHTGSMHKHLHQYYLRWQICGSKGLDIAQLKSMEWFMCLEGSVIRILKAALLRAYRHVRNIMLRLTSGQESETWIIREHIVLHVWLRTRHRYMCLEDWKITRCWLLLNHLIW
jgi:hypothetical protein